MNFSEHYFKEEDAKSFINEVMFKVVSDRFKQAKKEYNRGYKK